MLILFDGVLGLVVGSFLNVVIHRLPRMLEQQWRIQCAQWLHSTQSPSSDITPPYNLAMPASHCPHCNHPLGLIENIPLLSFIIQRGRCRSCANSISWRYPIVEFISGALALAVLVHFGMTESGGAALCFTWVLIAAAAIDWDHQLLPDLLTIPLLWLGLAFNLWGGFTDPEAAVIGAMAGYLSLWSVYWIFRLATGKEGMGYGDF